ncbi:MAG TPA: C2 family cysteine protease [Tepidisphaeraceae bacterium]|jgi:hypothetical protein|nr:C2 family cysteine protease [Tepidisphaeraceae bacterium]
MKASRTNNAIIENLEARTLMTAAPLGISEVAYDGGTQLRITGTTANDQITVKQTTAGLLIANGTWTRTVTDKINSLYINGEAGNNSITLDGSVTLNATLVGGGVNDNIVAGNGTNTLIGGTGKNVLQSRTGNDTLVCLGSNADTLVGGSGFDNFWTDNTKTEKIQNLTAAENNGGAVHKVAGFVNANAITVAGKKVAAAKTKTVAAATGIKEPAVDAGVSYASFSNDPIFASTGPSANDIFQGNVGDCYYLSVLASVAKTDPARIANNIADLGDGTVVVQLDKNGKPAFVREDESLPVNVDGTLAYAGLGQQNCTWVGLFEKAFCYVRTNQPSYDAIDAGWMDEAYEALGASPTSTYTADSANALMSLISKDLTAGQSVTYATNDNPNTDALIADHAYTVISVGLDSHGNAATVTLRNPWGCDINGNGNGYVTISAGQAFKSFTGMVAAKV